MTETHLVQVDCPNELLKSFDEACVAFGFRTRAEAIRQLMREFVEKHKQIAKEA